VAFDPQGETLASGGAGGTVKLWEARNGRLLRTLEGHQDSVSSVAFDPQGEILASGCSDGTVKLWETRNGRLLRTLGEARRSLFTFEGPQDRARSVAFDPRGETLASGCSDGTVKIWEARSGMLLRTLEGHHDIVCSVAFDPHGETLASGCADGTVKLWEARSGKLLRTLAEAQSDQRLFKVRRDNARSVAFDPQGEILAGGGQDRTVKLWEARSGKLLRTLEGHTSEIEIIAFSADRRLLASKGSDHTIRLWSCSTWKMLAVIPARSTRWIPALAFHPTLPLLAAACLAPPGTDGNVYQRIHLWHLDLAVLLGGRAAAGAGPVHHTTGKIVLVGDHSVGKSALGHRLIHGEFKEQASSHGQRFWPFPDLGQRRIDGTECEAILWDLAGQPDYRLVHALFIDDADLVLALFDASDIRDPLHGVEFWLKQLQRGDRLCPAILVAAQIDRGICPLTTEELTAFSRRHGIAGPISTSAYTGVGVSELVAKMKSMIPWEDKPATVTTQIFKRIKDFVLGLKESEPDGRIIVTPEDLHNRLQATDPDWRFTDEEMLTAVGHLENYGYVTRLRTSKGEVRVLLEPERLNNLASSFVLEARRNPKGLGVLQERRLLAGGYHFPELSDLQKDERDVLMDSAALLFLEHNVCFRETDPLSTEPYLVFPELINLKKSTEEDKATEDGAAYTVSGPTQNVFASLVVLLGYTHMFTRTSQWQRNARYEVGDGLVCGFREEERNGELNFVLCFDSKVGAPVRTLFQGMFESFLARRALTVARYEPVRCSKGHQLNRAVVRDAMKQGDEITFCSRCGEKLVLPKIAEPIQFSRKDQAEIETQRHAADQRTLFEQAIFQLQVYVTEQKIKPPGCFISYAWGVTEHERWVEKRLATDLQKAGIEVLLDRWENSRIGASVARFVERIEKSDRIVMVGTPLYRRKYENKDTDTGYVVAAEVELINNRLLGTEPQKESVLPLLLDGKKADALPPLLQGRVHADFRKEEAYFTTAFDLILDLYGISRKDAAVADLSQSLAPVEGIRRT
jgi:small GTP-binding protein domain